MRKFTLLLFLLCSYLLNAQEIDTLKIIKDDQMILRRHLETLIKKNPDLGEKIRLSEQKQERDLRNFIENKRLKKTSSSRTETPENYIIPVVVHIIHDNGNASVTDEKVHEAIRGLNEDYNLNNRDREDLLDAFKSIEANVGIEFRLAQKDPDGNPTNGITRTLDPQTILVDESHPEVKRATAWPREKYFNVWVVRNATAFNNSGYAFLPTQVDNENMYDLDGVVMAWWAFGETSEDYYSILTHEVGHWLGLTHTWGRAAMGSSDACGDDDGIEDTPNTRGFSGSCDEGLEYFSCGELCMIQNFMGYSKCTNSFTNGQKELMHASLNSSVAQRNNLWTPENLEQTLFMEPTPHLTYDAEEDIRESHSNDGTFASSINIALQNDAFVNSTGEFTENTHYSVANVPEGINVKLTALSATELEVSLMGTATNHTADLSGQITIQFKTEILTGETALYNPSLKVNYAFKDPYAFSFMQQNAMVSLPEKVDFTQFTSGLGTSSFAAAWTYGDYLRFENWGDEVTCNPGTMNVTPMAFGTEIGASTSWGEYGSEGTEWYEKQFYITSPTYTDWNGKTGYMGWKVYDQDQLVHYTWVRLVVADDGSSYRITASGYHENPETAINAGQTDGSLQLLVNGDTFKEDAGNFGSYTEDYYFELFNDEFALSTGKLINETHYTVTGLPEGITENIEIVGTNTLRLKLTGFASQHQETDNKTFSINFLDKAFKNIDASELVNNQFDFKLENINEYNIVYVDIEDVVLNETVGEVQFQLKDQSAGYYWLIYKDGKLQIGTGGDRMYSEPESGGNITLLKKGDLIQKDDKWQKEDKLSLANDNYFDWRGESGYAAVEFFGENDSKHYAWLGLQVSNDGQSVILKDYAYNTAPEGSLIAGIGEKITSINASASKFSENNISDGSFTESIDLSISNGRFSSTGLLTETTDYIINGIPEGLTASILVKSNTNASLTLTGNAVSNQLADSTEFTLKFVENFITNNGAEMLPEELPFKLYYTDHYIQYKNINDLLVDKNKPSIWFDMEIGDLANYAGLWKTDGLYIQGFPDPMVCLAGTNNLALLPEGYEIGKTITGNEWHTATEESSPQNISSISNTVWNGQTGYIGIEFTYGDNQHYAWLRITVAEDGQSFFIRDFGGNLIPGASIKAGETETIYQDIIAGNDSYTEPPVNNGYTKNETSIELLKGEFSKTGLLTSGTDYTIENLPAGLTGSVRVTDLSNAIFSFDGIAEKHEFVNSDTLRITFKPELIDGTDSDFFEYFLTFRDKYELIYIPIDAESYADNSQTVGRESDDYLFGIENTATYVTIQTWGNREVVCLDGSQNVNSFNEGDKINQGSFNWVNTGASLPTINVTGSTFDTYQGETIFIGVRKLVKESYYYGWIQLTPAEDGHSADIIDMAFSTEPNGPVFAGEKELIITAPRPDFITSSNEILVDEQVEFFDMTEGHPEQRTWIFTGGSPSSSVETNPIVTYNVAGKYNVKLISFNQAGSTEIIKEEYITVYPKEEPIADFKAESLVTYKGGSISFSDNSKNKASSWNWEFENGSPATSTLENPVVSYTTAGLFKVKLTATNVYGTDVHEKLNFITVYENTNTYCAASNVATGEDNIFITNVNFAGIDKDSKDENGYGNYIDNTAIVAKGQEYPFSMSVNNGHWGPISTAVWIDWNQDGDFDEDNETLLYHTDSKSNQLVSNIKIPLDAQGGLTRMRVRNSYTGSVEKCGVKTSGDIEDYSVLVNNLKIDLTASSTSILQGESVTFTDISSHSPNYWKWEFTGANIVTSEEKTPTVKYDYAGTYSVKLYVSNGTESGIIEKTNYITVSSTNAPQVQFTASQQTVVKGSAVQFNDLSKPDANSWEWAFTGGDIASSTSQNPSVTYNASGEYNVSLKVSNSYGDNSLVKIRYVKVLENANTYCTATNSTENDLIFIKNVTFAGINNNSTDEASYGDCTDQSAQVELGQTYPFTMDTENNYWGPISTAVWIDWNQDGDFDEANEKILYHTDDNSNLFTADVSVPMDALTGVTRMRVRNTYIDNVPKCGDETSGDVEDYSVVVSNASVVADFTASSTEVIKEGQVSFTDASLNNPTQWAWTFNGGTPASSTEQNPTVTYDEKGVFTVSLSVNDGNMENVKTVQGYISVTDPIVPEPFFIADNISIREGEQVSYTDNSLNDPNQWEWTFTGGTPETSTEQNPVVNYETAGVYSVNLKARNGNGSKSFLRTDYIEVKPSLITIPVANFLAGKREILSTDKIVFSDASENNPSEWNWNFTGGTPETSSEQNPIIQYNSKGVFAVSLTVKNSAGENLKTTASYITVRQPDMPTAAFTANLTDITQKEDVQFTSTSSFSNSYLWTFEGAIPKQSTDANPVVKYLNSGHFKVNLKVSNKYGDDQLEKVSYINVNSLPYPVSKFTVQTTTVFVKENIAFTDVSTNSPIQWKWIFEGANPSTSTDQNPIVSYESVGEYRVSLETVNAHGSNTIIKDEYITVKISKPVADFTSDLQEVADGGNVKFTDASLNQVDSREWTFEGGTPATSTEQNPEVTYAVAGNYKVTLKVTNTSGTDTKAVQLKIEKSNQAPTDILLSNVSVSEDEVLAAVIGSLSAVDAIGVCTFEIVAGGVDNECFSIDEGNLILNTELNYTIKSSYRIIVKVTDESGASYEKEFVISVMLSTGIEPILETELQLYPNPVVDHLKIQGVDIKNVKVFNVAGKLVLASNNEGDLLELDLNFTDLKQGLYLVRIELNNNEIITKKVVK